MSLIRCEPSRNDYREIVGPDHADLKYIHLGLLNLSVGASWNTDFTGIESLLVILGGQCDIQAGNREWRNLGERVNVFDGKPTAVYLPPDTECRVIGCTDMQLAVCSAVADAGPEVTLITPDMIDVRTVGRGPFERTIYDVFQPESSEAQRLIVGETFNAPGRWSSYPPHKHDLHNPPEESDLEEVYYFRLNPPNGFGVQRVYADDFDEIYTLKDGDVITIPRGYHPLAAAPGYELYYLWTLAGEHRIMHPCEDPTHAWVGSQV